MPLLDEPTNHLDAEPVAWLSAISANPRHRRGDHPDRYFLDNVAGWIPARPRRRHS
jgi:ATPase subunit of ABC transporter with duplicated ATPase domains